MQKRKFSAKLISLILTLSFLISTFSVFAFANEEADADAALGDGLNVVYNRTFDEGWSWNNGIDDSFAKGNSIGVAYENRNSKYNYYLKFDKVNTDVAYAHINTQDKLHTSGSTFIEFEIASSLNNAMGQAVRVSVQGDTKTLVEFKNDGMYILGENVGRADYAMKWEQVAFEFNFDYATETAGAKAGEYSVTAYYNGAELTEVIWNEGMYGMGISQLRFSFGNMAEVNVDSWYAIDNLRMYSGVDTFTALDATEYGSAVDATKEKDFTLVGDSVDPDGFIRGEREFSDRDEFPRFINVHYNRHFGEGWTVNQAGSKAALDIKVGTSNLDIRSEKDLAGNINYFLRFRALDEIESYMEIPLYDASTDGKLFIEFDLKTGVNADLGGIVKAVGPSSTYIASLVDGQLVVDGTPLGYIGSAWAHLVYVFDYDNNQMTLYYGENGVYTTALPTTVTDIRIGQEGTSRYDSYADWYGIDNLKIYSDSETTVVLPDDDYGSAVDAEAAFDFPLDNATKPEAPVLPDEGDDDTSGPAINVNPEEHLSGAPEIERMDMDDTVNLRYNRHYGEGWGFGVGGGSHSGCVMSLEAERTLDMSYNYYQYYEAIGGKGNAYWTFSTATISSTDKVFIELDIKAVEGCDVGTVIQMMMASGKSNTIGFSDGYLTIGCGTEAKLGKITEDQWVHMAIEMDFGYALHDPTANPGEYKVSVHYGNNRFYSYVVNPGGNLGFDSGRGIRIGFYSQSAAVDGQYWCMDNLQVYAGCETFVNVPADDYGALINPNLPKDFVIQQSSTSLDTMIEESLFMKVGSEYTLLDNERKPSLVDEDGVPYGAPIKIGDNVWVPLDTILNFLSYPIYIHEDGLSFDISTGSSITYITLGKNTAVVAGNTVNLSEAPAIITDKSGHEFLGVTVDDVTKLFPEFYIVCNAMNLIIFTKHEQITGDVTEEIFIDIMKDFVFDYIKPEEVYDRVANHTNNFDHPYLVVNQQRFDELHAVWAAAQLSLDDDPTNDVEYDTVLYDYIRRCVNSGASSYNNYSANGKIADGKPYEGINAASFIYDNESLSIGLLHSYPQSNGYDPIGGRLYPPYDAIERLAYAWQVTRDIRYAQMTFDYCSAMVDWDHWGPGHFLNAADCASAVARGYDWCYDAWVELGLDVDKIADGIYYHGALQGYLVATGQPDPHGRRGGNGSNYTTMVNNWNAVCTTGVAAAALAVMDYTGFTSDSHLASNYARQRAKEFGGEMMTTVVTEVISRNFKSLVQTGLDIYAPDGSYEESVSYWAYGANNLFLYAQMLESSMGTDLGIMDTWGIDRTCYSILHMVSSDYRVFAYNDGSVGGSCSSGQFNYVAQSVNDDFLYLVRRMHITEGGLGVTQSDTFFYKEVDENADVVLPLQYHHIGIHGYTTRSSWDRGAVFAGLLGGNNDDGHGHIDAGQWIYYNKGIPWIEDIGPDGYNTYKYFSNNHMYKTNPEGHNVICLSSAPTKLPAGQERSSISPMIKVGDNEYGSFAITDTTPAFGGFLTSAYRGMLLTNDRNTVVIQDEITPNGSQTMYWFAHYDTGIINGYDITNNGRTAYLYSRKSSVTGKEHTLRLSIVSPVPRGIEFYWSDAYTFVLPATQEPGFSESMGKQPESDRSNWNKLCIKFENFYTVQCAVVLEVIEDGQLLPIGYQWTLMNDWVPYADKRVVVDDDSPVVEDVSSRSSIRLTEMRFASLKLDGYVENGDPFEDISSFYKTFCNMEYVVNKFGRETVANDKLVSSYIEKYDYYRQMYLDYYNDVVETSKNVSEIRDTLIGS